MNISKGRIRLLSVFILLAAFILVIKLYMVQIVNGSDFVERADRQYQRPSGNIFERGTIYFTEKNGEPVTAAMVKTGFMITINPKLVQKAGVDKVYTLLKAQVPDLGYDEFYSRANKQNDTYEEVRKKVDEKLGEKIAAAKIPGVSMFIDKWRFYPGGSLASHVLGLMGYKDDEFAGRYGLERSYEDALGRDSDSVYVNFFAEIFSNIKKTVLEHEKLEADIITSIEPDTQQYVERMLTQINKQYNSDKTGVIIMDPKTGEIIAMGLAPTFDPNNLGSLKDPGVLSNSLVESVYEMGSVVKPLTMSVGIDLGKVNANTKYNDTGSVTMNNKTMYNFDKKGRGSITLQYALSKSLNTGFIYVAQQVGNDAMRDYFLKYGIGEKTGIDLPNESSGLVKNLSTNRDIEYATASFGQGIAMSPVELIRAYSAIANNGKMVNPHVVKEIKYKIGGSKVIKPDFGAQVVKPDTARQVVDMMVYNVDNSLLDGKAKNERYAVAAKTGTAQIVTAQGAYDEYRFLHSFVGFLPAYNPRFLVFIYTVNPHGVSYASETLAKPFIELSKFLINHFELPPDR